MYHWVPRIIKGLSHIAGVKAVAQDEEYRDRKQQIGGEGGQELRDRLDVLGEPGAQSDGDADRNPDDRRQRDEDDDPHERERAVARGDAEILPREQSLRGASQTDRGIGGGDAQEPDPQRIDGTRRRRSAPGAPKPLRQGEPRMPDPVPSLVDETTDGFQDLVWRNKSSTQLFGTICAAVCSKRNFSAQATIGRNSS